MLYNKIYILLLNNINFIGKIFNKTGNYINYVILNIVDKKGEIFNMSKIPAKINSIVDEFVSRANAILGNRVKKIILYGSYARGDYSDSSDIDIMILTDLNDNEMYENFVKISDMAYDIEEENNFDITLSPLIKNIDKFNYWLEALPFYMNVQREGVVLSES